MAGQTVRSVVIDVRSNWTGGYGSTGEGYSTTQVGLRKIELMLGGALLGSVDGDDFDVYTSAGDAFTMPPARYKPPWKGNPKDDATATNRNWLTVAGSSSGTIDEFPQRYLLVYYTPYDVDEIIINNYHFQGKYTARGIRQVKIITSDQELSSTEVNNVLQAVPGGVVRFDGELPEHSHPVLGGNEADDYIISMSLPDITAMKCGFSVGALFGSDIEINPCGLKAGLGVGTELSADQLIKNKLLCGLAIGVHLTGQATNDPAKLLAGIGLGAKLSSKSPDAARLRARLCTTCLMRAVQVPTPVLRAAFGLGAKMSANQHYMGKMSVGIGIGCKMATGYSKPPCLAKEFQHMDWF